MDTIFDDYLGLENKNVQGKNNNNKM